MVYLAIDRLRCDACRRNPTKARPRPTTSTIRYLGQFGEEIMGDMFYVVDVANVSYCLLGIICHGTRLHKVGYVADRNPETVFDVLRTIWLLPFGVPVEALFDQDGSFLGFFLEEMERLGVVVRYCPVDAHHQLGLIERHDAAWRWMYSRTADAGRRSGT